MRRRRSLRCELSLAACTCVTIHCIGVSLRQYGGGITPSNAKKFLDAGASHVIVTSYIFTAGALDLEKLKQLSAITTPARLVLDFSCRRGADGQFYVVTDRWQRFTTFAVTKENLIQLSHFCSEFLVHGVDVEGKQLGIDEDLVKRLGEWSPLPVTYAGGVRNVTDLELIERLGKGRVDATIGSALDIFGGPLAYASVVAWHNHRQQLHQHAQSDDAKH